MDFSKVSYHLNVSDLGHIVPEPHSGGPIGLAKDGERKVIDLHVQTRIWRA